MCLCNKKGSTQSKHAGQLNVLLHSMNTCVKFNDICFPAFLCADHIHSPALMRQARLALRPALWRQPPHCRSPEQEKRKHCFEPACTRRARFALTPALRPQQPQHSEPYTQEENTAWNRCYCACCRGGSHDFAERVTTSCIVFLSFLLQMWALLVCRSKVDASNCVHRYSACAAVHSQQLLHRLSSKEVMSICLQLSVIEIWPAGLPWFTCRQMCAVLAHKQLCKR